MSQIRPADLRGTVESLLAEWSLSPGETVRTRGGWIQHVRALTGEALTLKLVADASAFAAERAALEAFAGHGSVRLVAADTARRVLLLERAEPGAALSGLVAEGRDEEATRAALEVIRQLQEAVPTSGQSALPRLDDEAAEAFSWYAHTYADAGAPIPGRTVERARAELRDLRSGMADHLIVLHGDLHHDNILRAGREEWLAIDPKGRLGEPVCEYPALLRNPIGVLARRVDLARFIGRRMDQVVEHTGTDRERLVGWTRVLAVVAACWALEDGQPDWTDWLGIASALL